MINFSIIKKTSFKLLCFVLLIISFSSNLNAHELTKDEKKAARKARNQEKIDSGKLMITLLAGPAYTPELGSTIAGNISRHGAILWTGAGSVGTTAKDFQSWLPNFGIGYRLTVQPRMNLRLDYGFGRESSGFYFNFNEAF